VDSACEFSFSTAVFRSHTFKYRFRKNDETRWVVFNGRSGGGSNARHSASGGADAVAEAKM
jgi:hypothetical protein